MQFSKRMERLETSVFSTLDEEKQRYLKQGKEVYLTHGLEDYFEPAIRVLHNDGNPSLLLKYVSHENRKMVSDTL